jgi:pimeloyl-ACP methyl ester carboxylesterase
MAIALAADGTRLHYEVSGPRDGEPLLLVQGLGADARGWIRQRRALSGRYRCIVFDNRGAGRSDHPEGPYDLEVMALDALSVLDAVGVERAHVLGASMGGVIAQIVGVRHPERTRSLVLACTAARHHQWRRELLAEWADVASRKGMGALAQQAVRWLIGPRSLRRFWPAVGLIGPLAMTGSAEPFVAQVQAILAMDDSLRPELCSVAVPTLALVGSQDILTPMGDSEEIAELVPGAELAVIRGAAHGFMLEHGAAFNRTVLGFLDRTTARVVVS